MTKNIKKKSWMRWVVFLAGLEIIAISINFFYGPINIAAGGSTGISILVDAVWEINRSITVLVVNILMLVLAAIFLGKKTTKNVALGSLLLPILMEITPSFKITNNQLLAVIYGTRSLSSLSCKCFKWRDNNSTNDFEKIFLYQSSGWLTWN